MKITQKCGNLSEPSTSWCAKGCEAIV